MVAQASQSIDDIFQAALHKIGTNQVRQRHANIRKHHQFRVKRLEARQIQHKAIGLLRPLLQAFDAMLKAPTACNQTHNHNFGLRQQAIKQTIKRRLIVGIAYIGSL